jgi:shikimate kinase/3-dehydroquinate synthase
MHIFLYGPSGSGKSTVGQRLARNLHLPFVDSDRVIEASAGMTIPWIMETEGETRLRDLETMALQQIISGKESVVALGGGALLREENRALVEGHGSVIVLVAELPTLLERLQQDPNERPLLAGDLPSKLTSYLERRAGHYASFPRRVQVDGKTPEQIAAEIQLHLGRYHLSAMGEYDVLTAPVSRLADHPMQRAVIVTDEIIAPLHADRVATHLQAAGVPVQLVTVPAGEAYKNLATVQRLWNAFLEAGLDRKSTVIALGGGVIGDLAGFAASTYMRGIQWVCLPTTLLSMVDASLGGKTGFDLPAGKNLIGSFYPPALVLADPQFLKTLPEAELISGLAEVVKHGIIADPVLFDLCERGRQCIDDELDQTVRRAMAVKIQVIEEDPYERGPRAALNLGHTVGHAVELVSGFRLRHGEAVAIGMVAEAKLAERLGVAERGLSERIAGALARLQLPVEIPEELLRVDILRAIRVDKKKNDNVIRFALPAEIGRVELVDVADLEIVLEEV